MKNSLQLRLGVLESSYEAAQVTLLREDSKELARHATGLSESHQRIEDREGHRPPDLVAHCCVAANYRQKAFERRGEDREVSVFKRAAARLARARAPHR